MLLTPKRSYGPKSIGRNTERGRSLLVLFVNEGEIFGSSSHVIQEPVERRLGAEVETPQLLAGLDVELLHDEEQGRHSFKRHGKVNNDAGFTGKIDEQQMMRAIQGEETMMTRTDPRTEQKRLE